MDHTAVQAMPAFARHDLGITPFWEQAPEAEQRAQREWLAELGGRGDVRFAPGVFVSRLAGIHPERLHIGERSYLAAHVYVYGDHTIGADCTLNPFAELRGRVTLGDGVRIGAHTSVLGFNHSMAPDRPIHQQPLISKGITVGDDVWIGSHVVVVDGVNIGSHSVIGAGSVVTKDVPPWSVVAGNPARRIRDRRGGRPDGDADLSRELERLADTARRELPELLERCWDTGRYVDRPAAPPSLRALCDAVELSAMLAGGPPPHVPDIAGLLRAAQDERTGLVPEIGAGAAEPSADGHAPVNYHVIAVGAALGLLGSGFAHPVRFFDELSSAELRAALDGLPWGEQAWRAGSWVDAAATAFYHNRKDFGRDGEIETLFGWLVSRCDPATGLWGRPAASGWLEPVNGTYRLIRGSFAQFGLPLPYPERTVDSVLAHAADERFFRDDRGTACNVLDVSHPLWFAAGQTGHRRAEGQDWARWQLRRVLRSWRPGAGFSFGLEAGAGFERTPGLLGTEMWLSITWLLADHLGMADALGYRPLGVHRPEPALPLASEQRNP